MKITILGNGNMAFAIARGLKDSFELEIWGRNLDKLKSCREKLNSNVSIVEYGEEKGRIDGQNIILAFKPQNIEEVGNSLIGKAQHIFSILAGTTIETISKNISSENYVRVMPNLSSIFQKSTTAITGDRGAKDLAIDIFSKIGEVIWLNSEDEVDIATAIAGSGPAYLSMVAEAMSDGGVKMGLKREDANKLVSSLFGSFAPLISKYSPYEIKNRVMSPRGTTAFGYSSLEDRGVRAAFISAVESGYLQALNLRKV